MKGTGFGTLSLDASFQLNEPNGTVLQDQLPEGGGQWTEDDTQLLETHQLYHVKMQIEGSAGAGFSPGLLVSDSSAVDPTFIIDPSISDAQDYAFIFSVGVGAVPETAIWAMMILGFLGVGFVAYRRKQNGLSLRVA